ncbi:MAG: arylesterase [Zoogloeaceae bacterium]|nr:arylesterase [Zoogloeaceae bacterium]
MGSVGAMAAPRILVWGDSLSAGYGLRMNEAWPTLLQSALTRKGFQHTVVNASVSGETSAGGRSRLPQALKEHRPSIVIIELGANDGLRGLPPQMMADNLRAMVDMVRQAGARPLLVGMEMPPNFGTDYVNRFRQAYVEVAQATASHFVPFLMAGFAQRQELFQPDGIHPTREAQPLIVETVWPGLEPLLKDR